MSLQMFNLRGVTVHFPHEPYDVQKKYMEKVIECLQSGVNGILESPTGTGKTLSLLCSSLAWLEDHKAAMQLTAGLHRSPDPNAGFLSQLQSLFDQQEAANRPSPICPKIIYSSRTHSQLSQAINELKKTNYRYVKSVVLGSRDQLCINPDVQKLQDNASKLRVCRHKVTTRTCPFHLNYDTKMTRSEYQDTPVMDIEDLGKLGKKFVCCPYYAAKTLKGRADIVFMPYNYLVDAKSRKAHGVELEGNVVIFDEAHNIENMCEESMSFQLLSSDLALCIKETTHAADLKQQKETEAAAGMEGVDPDFTLLDIAKIKAILLSLEKYVDELLVQVNAESTTKPGNFMFTMLEEAGVSRHNKDELLDLLDKIVSFLEVNAVGAFSPRGTGLNRFVNILNSLYSVEGDGSSVEAIFKKKFKVHIQKDANKKKKPSHDVWTVSSNASKKLDWCLNCWCFSPSVSMDNLLKQGVRCIILTSGTLSPLSSFAAELGIPFPVQLENPHVIKEEQIYVSVLSNGYDGQLLNCSYDNRNNPAYLASLGRTVCNLCRVIPGGVLLFFPSYAVMRNFVETWTANGTMTSLALVKPTVMEVQRNTDFSSLIQEHCENVDSPEKRGCLLMAVCRGRMSEGMDFTDQYARAAIIVGFPLPPCFDPRVQLKKQYLDESPSRSIFSGNDWYVLQATRAVNQAIGRVIRHQHDFGAILFCDKRYSEPRNLSQLSKWVKEKTKLRSSFSVVLKELAAFFKAAGVSNENSQAGTKMHVASRNAFGIPSKDGTSVSRNLTSAQHSVAENNENVMEAYRRPTEEQLASFHKVEQGQNLFDVLNNSSAPGAVDFSSTHKVNFRNTDDKQTNEDRLQNAKRRKLYVPLKGIGPPEPSMQDGASTSRTSSPKSSQDIWKSILASLKKSLKECDYNSVCSSMKLFLRTNNSDALAEALALCLVDAPNRDELLTCLAKVVTASKREDFVVKCRSHW
ncbi:regulator of telomere elongation helicase 1 homolog [Amblyomma americanum]